MLSNLSDSKVILKLECLVYKIYILFHLIINSKSHFDSNKSKKWSIRKKNLSYIKKLSWNLTIIGYNQALTSFILLVIDDYR